MALLRFASIVSIILNTIFFFIGAVNVNIEQIITSIFSIILAYAYISFLGDFELLQKKVDKHLKDTKKQKEQAEQTEDKKEEITTEN